MHDKVLEQVYADVFHLHVLTCTQSNIKKLLRLRPVEKFAWYEN